MFACKKIGSVVEKDIYEQFYVSKNNNFTFSMQCFTLKLAAVISLLLSEVSMFKTNV